MRWASVLVDVPRSYLLRPCHRTGIGEGETLTGEGLCYMDSAACMPGVVVAWVELPTGTQVARL